jgi:hypothetical protein
MPESTTGKKLSYKSVVDCFKSADNDSDRLTCRKYFNEKLNPKSEYRAKDKKRPSNIGEGTPKNVKDIMDNRMKMGSDPVLKKKKKKGK